MDEKSEQINIRASQRVAQELRAEAQRRRLPLGEALEELLALARADSQPGSWVELDVETERALRSVAAAEGVPPATQLARMARGHLRAQLLALAAQLEDSAQSRAVASLSGSSSSEGLLLHAKKRGEAPSGALQTAPAPEAPSDSSTAPQEAEEEEELDRVGIFSVFE